MRHQSKHGSIISYGDTAEHWLQTTKHHDRFRVQRINDHIFRWVWYCFFSVTIALVVLSSLGLI